MTEPGPTAPNPFSHVDQRVPELEAAVAFYGAFLPEVGFSKYLGGKLFRCWTTGKGEGPAQPWFGLTEDPDHRPNGSRIAFWVASRAEVDRVAGLVGTAGATELSGPKEMPEYQSGYYALFFADPWGNPLEILHWTD